MFVNVIVLAHSGTDLDELKNRLENAGFVFKRTIAWFEMIVGQIDLADIDTLRNIDGVKSYQRDRGIGSQPITFP